MKNPPMSRVKVGSLVFRRATFLLLLTTLGTASCGQEAEVAEERLRPVRWMEVLSSGGERERTFSGVARAGLQTQLSFSVAGTVSQVTVQVGDSLRAGQSVASLDPSDYQLQVADAEAAFGRAEAESRNASSNYERIQRLYENGNASLSQLEGARTGSEAAAAAVESARSRLDLARSRVADTRLSAPVDGVVESVVVEANENVRAGQTVAVLASGARAEVEVGIPEALITGISVGQAVTVGIDALAGASFPARVVEVGVRTDARLNTFPVTVQLQDEANQIRAGMAADVSFNFGSVDGAPQIIVPLAAVGADTEGRFVFVLEDQGGGSAVVHRTGVTVGEPRQEGLEILGGLEDGQRIVTAGVSRISDGQRVAAPAEGAP
jgi:RND family efflux transporter MFP subunit